MSETDDGRTDTQDGEILADLFDTFLQEILEGRTPDLAAFQKDRPELRERIQKTWALACSVAGRREPSRPVLGGYEIVRELGHGGMGTVYLARHQALQREVAIKVLPHSLAMSPRAKQRFLEEARALARLRHDHVVRIHRIIDHAEMLAFEMEFIDGPSLRTLVAELRQKAKSQAIASLAEVLGLPVEDLGTRNTAEWFVRLGIRIARALGEVHRHGLVHRDVKPSNILLRRNGQPVLADFGLAREGDLDASQTAFAGTPVYAAPERLRFGDADLDARADVYSLGVTLYEALSLSAPFGGSTTHEVLRRIEEGNLPSLRKQAPHVSRDLETVIGTAMEPDRRHRYPTADEFADDLERLLSLQPIHARPAGPVRRAVKFVRRHQKMAASAVAGAVLVALVTWPVVAHARAASEARERAALALHAARSALLCPENLGSSWATAQVADPGQTLRTLASRTAQLAALGAALASYDAAAAATPDDVDLQVERDVVRTVASLVRADGAATADGTDQARLPALTALLVQRATDKAGLGTWLQEALVKASPADRFAAGLFAFLLSDHGTSRQCWHGLEEAPKDHPFLDACQALQLVREGDPERAYPRLFHAARAFPKSVALAFAITDAAIATGDLQLAEAWSKTLPDGAERSVVQLRRRRLDADMLAAMGQVDAARRLYRELTRLDPSDPEPLQRLASLALQDGDTHTARRLAEDMLRRWPDLAQPRLQLARTALQRRDLATYLRLARRVLAEDLRHCSSGAATQLASILRLGGLQQLYAEASASLERDGRAWRSPDVHPLSTWLPPSLVGGIEQALRLCAAFDRSAAAAGRVDPRPVAIALRSAWWTMLTLPRLTVAMPWPCQLAGVAVIPPVLETATRLISPELLPFQRSLGDRLYRVTDSTIFAKRLTDLSTNIGNQLLLLGDANGDTLSELCVTAPPAGTNGGAGYLELRNLRDGTLLATWSSEEDNSCFARAVVGLGDVDGDLCDDVVVGAPIIGPGVNWQGAAMLKSGRTGATLWTLEGDRASFGAALASLGDVDGDGVPEVVVGEPPMSLDPDDRGLAVVVSGKTGRILHELVAERGGTWFGGAVANAGDVNGDGVDDVLVGGNFGRAPGLVSLFDGRQGVLLSTFGDENPDTMFGWCLTGLGDVDGDGMADFAIGAPASGASRDPGSVHALSGRTGKSIFELRGEHPGERLGIAMCRVPNWRTAADAALVVATRRGGPIGTGYVRVFSTADGAPVQTFAGGAIDGAFGCSMVDLGDRDGDGLRDLGVALVSHGHLIVRSLSWADYLRGKEPR